MNSINNLIKYINEEKLGDYLLDEKLSKHTSLKIGGIANILFYPKDIEGLRKVLKFIREHNIEYYIIGNGTNLLINERYFKAVFINLKNIKIVNKLNKNKFFISSGNVCTKVAYNLGLKGYSKLEFLSVIPGSIGGAIYMNAGAYDSDIANIIEYVLVLDDKLDLKLLNKIECDFKYRSSSFQKNKYIILGGIFKLNKSKIKDAPISKIRYYVSNKKETQPLSKHSAGSTFKNTSSYPAWKIVDELGYRGLLKNGAKVSPLHTNFIINNNNATFSDIYDLTLQIKEDAKTKLNIDLEYEWEIIK